MGLVFVSETNIGNKRRVNEDSFWPRLNQHDHRPDDPDGMLFIVADGMGGHGAGDVASQLAVREIPSQYYALGNEVADIGDRLNLAIRHAHRQLQAQAAQSSELENMGTTVAIVVVKYDEVNQQGEVWVAWAGDSRVYLLRQGRLQQLTRDHSKVWPLIEAGQITWDQLRFHPERSRVTNALTVRRATAEPEIQRYGLEPGDLLLLCSDGLSGEVKPEEIEHTLSAYPPQQALSYLIAQANGTKEFYKDGQKVLVEGGNDNITSILIKIPGGESEPTRVTPALTGLAAPARPPRLLWLIGGSLIAALLVIAGLSLAFFSLNSSGANPLTSALPPPTEMKPTDVAVIDSKPTGVSVAVLEKATATYTPESTTTQAEPTPAEALIPTVTRGPLSSPTLPPTATPPPTATATPPVTPTEVITPAGYLPPRLIEPQPYELDQSQHNAQEVTFIWEWPGELTDQLSFEIRVWLEGDDPQGVYDAKELKHNPTFVPLGEYQYAVTLKLSTPGIMSTSSNYLWSVGVVQTDPEYKWLNLESESRRISILVPGGN